MLLIFIYINSRIIFQFNTSLIGVSLFLIGLAFAISTLVFNPFNILGTLLFAIIYMVMIVVGILFIKDGIKFKQKDKKCNQLVIEKIIHKNKMDKEEVQVLENLERILGRKIARLNNINYDTIGVQIVENKIVGLALYKCELNYLPDYIGELKSLQVLGLSSNQLKELPESIGRLNSLKILDLDNNQLKKLPESIGQLSSLEGLLSLRNNQLTKLPESIGKLKSLKEFNLSKNKLTTLPDAFKALESLEILDIRFNPLSKSKNQDDRTKIILKYLKKHGVKIYKS